MRRHWAYFKYVVRHKWFVYLACRSMGVSWWQAVKHDWHKFLPSEWFPYASAFYNSDGSKRYVESAKFSQAWNLHQKRGKHHWQHWLITWDRGDTEPLEMPWKYAAEMVADWWGAGRAITGEWDAPTWYENNKGRIIVTADTRQSVEFILSWSSKHFETPEVVAQRKRILGY